MGLHLHNFMCQTSWYSVGTRSGLGYACCQVRPVWGEMPFWGFYQAHSKPSSTRPTRLAPLLCIGRGRAGHPIDATGARRGAHQLLGQNLPRLISKHFTPLANLCKLTRESMHPVHLAVVDAWDSLPQEVKEAKDIA